MRWALFSAAIAASITAGSAAAFVGVQPPSLSWVEQQAGPAMCEPVSFNVYFDRNDARLTGPAQRTLDVVGNQVRGCDVAAIRIQAATNTIATDEGRQLQGERGAAVLAALEARGVTAEQVLVTTIGAPEEPASAAPDHITIGVDARGAPVSARGKLHPLESDA